MIREAKTIGQRSIRQPNGNIMVDLVEFEELDHSLDKWKTKYMERKDFKILHPSIFIA